MNAYNSGSTRALAVYVVFGMLAFICLVSIISTIGEIDLIQKIDDGRYVSNDSIDSNDDRQQFIGVFYLLGYLASAIAFLMWIYRANSNLNALRAQEVNYSPGWAVGWFFVPFMNLVRPYQVVSEIWKGSNPAAVERVPGLYIDSKSSSLVGLWWGLHIFRLIVWQIAEGLYESAEEVSEILSADYVYMFSDATDIAGIIVVIMLVRSIDQSQSRRYEVIASLPAPEMPSIPVISQAQAQAAVCPDCKSEIPESSKFCPVCGATLIAQNKKAAEPAVTGETVEAVIECNLCGKDVKASLSSCPYCGAGL